MKPNLGLKNRAAFCPSGNSLAYTNKVTLYQTQLVLRRVTVCGIPSWYGTSHPGQLSLLPPVRWEMSTSHQCPSAGKVTTGLASQWICIRDSVSSRVCAVAQYAVLEAIGKVNGIGEISNPSPSQTLRPIWMPLQIYHYVRPGSRCAKFD